MSDAIPRSLERNLGCLSRDEQQVLLSSRVTVCGCGGLGGQVVENLARIGVGQLLLIDPDVFTVSNLNRQLGALAGTLGRNKAEVLAGRTAEIHDLCRAEAHVGDFRELNDLGRARVVVDCLDRVDARLELARRCSELEIPLVHGAVNGWYGQVGVQLPGSRLLETLYPDSGSVDQPPPVAAMTVGVTGSLQAMETVTLLLGGESRLQGGWLSIDLLRGDFDFIPILPENSP